MSAEVRNTLLALGAAAVAAGLGALFAGRHEDRAARYQLRRTAAWIALLVFLLSLIGIWHPFHGRTALVLGLVTAGLAFGLQEVVGAIFGWVNILSGRVYRVGDRVALAGVEGDVLDITPLRTKILEMGKPPELALGGSDGTSDPMWVRGRQYTGRIVTISNKATFEQPVYNYSSIFEYIWEELTMPISYRSDWHVAERIMLDAVREVSDTAGAERAIETMVHRYPVPRAEVEPRVFVRATDNWMELSARFVVPVREARSTKSDLTRIVRERFDEAGVEISSTTNEQFVRFPEGLPDPARDGAAAQDAPGSTRPLS